MQNDTLDSLENKAQELLQELREYDYYSPYQEILQDLEDAIQKIIKNANNKEKIIQILTNDLDYCYCDNCKYSDYETYRDEFCDGYYRKYSNWALSSATAEEIADKIIQLGEIYPISKEELNGVINNAE